MNCVFCGNKVIRKNVNFIYEEGNKYIIVEKVPAEVCTKCGEKTYSPEVTDELLRFAKDEFPPEKIVEVPVFNFNLSNRTQ